VRLAHAVITTSPGYADVLARRYRVPAPRLVRNVISAEARVGRSPQHSFDAVGVYVGAVTRHRGLEQAIEALPHVPRCAWSWSARRPPATGRPSNAWPASTGSATGSSCARRSGPRTSRRRWPTCARPSAWRSSSRRA
jgi:hypothetical protein